MTPEPRRIKVLVVDDEKAILQAFSTRMRQFNYEMELFLNPAAALEALALNPSGYQLVITDMRMPQMDGLTFLKTLRSLCPNLPVIFMTGYVTEEIEKAVAQYKKIVFLEKPFPLEKIFKETIPQLLAK